MHVRFIIFRKFLPFTLLFGCLWYSLAPLVGAAMPEQKGITVAPARLVMSLGKNVKDYEGTVSVRNTLSAAVSFEAGIRSVQQVSSGILVPTDQQDPVMSSALELTPTEFTLAPGQSINIKLRFRDIAALGPGGHYASLIIRERTITGRQVSVAQAVSVMIFATKEDGATRKVTIRNVVSDASIVRPPRSVTASFGNIGNTALVPRATVRVYDPSGKMVASGIMNEGSAAVLPGREIRLRSYLSAGGFVWMPGRYKVEVLYRHDGSDEQKIARLTQWSFPPIFVAVLAAACISLIALARFLWWIWPGLKLRLKGRPHMELRTPVARPRKAMDIIIRRK